MTVKELREKLEFYSDNAIVLINARSCRCDFDEVDAIRIETVHRVRDGFDDLSRAKSDVEQIESVLLY